MNYQTLARTQAPKQSPSAPLLADPSRPFGYYWIQVEQDGPWVAAFWYEGQAPSPGFFDCSNTPGFRHVYKVHAVGEAVPLPEPTTCRPEAQPQGYHWVQAEPFGDWVVALWRNEPFSHRGNTGHGYFDGSNWWNSNYHVIPTPHAYGGKVSFAA